MLSPRLVIQTLVPPILCAILAGAALAQQAPDSAVKKRVFARCRVCHSVDEGAAQAVGPSLRGIVGRQAGTNPGFEYSPAMRAAGIVWSRELLDRFLQNPAALIPDNRMSFAGIRSAEERLAVILFLEESAR